MQWSQWTAAHQTSAQAQVGVKNGNVYKQKGEGPTLTFVIEIGAGNVTLTK